MVRKFAILITGLKIWMSKSYLFPWHVSNHFGKLIITNKFFNRYIFHSLTATIRHASTITTMCFWILFLWDKLSTYFFTKDVIDDSVQELERIEGEIFQLNKAEKEEKRPTVITNRKLTLVRYLKIRLIKLWPSFHIS